MPIFIPCGLGHSGIRAVFELITAVRDVFIIDILRNSKNSVPYRTKFMAAKHRGLEWIHVPYHATVRRLRTDRRLDAVIHFDLAKVCDISDLGKVSALQHRLAKKQVSRRNGHSAFADFLRLRTGQIPHLVDYHRSRLQSEMIWGTDSR